MCTPLAYNALQVSGGLYAANQQRKAGESQAAYYNFLAKESINESNQFGEKAARDIGTLRKSTKKLKGVQNTTMAASGVNNSVTAEAIERDTNRQEFMDEMAIKYNADLQSERSVSKAKQYYLAGQNAKRAGEINAATTLLSTAGSVADTWMKWRRY